MGINFNSITCISNLPLQFNLLFDLAFCRILKFASPCHTECSRVISNPSSWPADRTRSTEHAQLVRGKEACVLELLTVHGHCVCLSENCHYWSVKCFTAQEEKLVLKLTHMRGLGRMV